MSKTKIKTADKVKPMIYAYTTPGVTYHDGWIKIGYTERDVDTRIKEQVQTANIKAQKEWTGVPLFDDTSEYFRDSEFHTYLAKLGIERKDPEPDDEGLPEWFHTDNKTSKAHFNAFRENHGILSELGVSQYSLRKEQKQAVEQTAEYFDEHKNDKIKPEFLWNAKPRFGKTLTAYEFCKAVYAERVLIVTNRPSIANSWYDDYEKFLGPESGYFFVSNSDSLKGKKGVLEHKKFNDLFLGNMKKTDSKELPTMKLIEFISLQDLKGSIDFGGKWQKNEYIADLVWDVLIIDEAHEGIDTYKTDVAFDNIKRRFTLHLSGTPFKALANDKFASDAIYNWTYADEQRAKRDWDISKGENPYGNLPELSLFTYKMSDIIRDEVEQGVEIDGEQKEYAFDLNEFFSTNAQGRFIHDEDVDRFLDALTTQTKFPFSTPELRDELKHTFWLLNRVDSAKALEKKLKNHPVFKDYVVVLAAGDGESEEDVTAIGKSYDMVVNAIRKHERTITLSVKQLTTGVTIPEWTAVMMLSSIKSPAQYMQAAFRAQNPCLFRNKGEFYRKERAYVFDFDPARTLIIFEKFANDLCADTVNGAGSSDKRKDNVRELLNFFPVIGEDENGEMVELDAEKVLTIPRKIKSVEVVKRGFMSNFLFRNISNVFGAPQAVLDVIQKFEPISEPKTKDRKLITTAETDSIEVDSAGNAVVDETHVVGLSSELFGEKIYDIQGEMKTAIDNVDVGTRKERQELAEVKKTLTETIVTPVMDVAKEHYGSEMSKSTQNDIERKLKADVDRMVAHTHGQMQIETRKLESERLEKLENANASEAPAINAEFDERRLKVQEQFKADIQAQAEELIKKATETVVREVEHDKVETEKKSVEDRVRDHLRGFSRTIPSFLMAYGTSETTLENFDKGIPDDVFLDVTSITKQEFLFLRDGGDYTDVNTGEKKHFDGKLFDEIVFNASVKEFFNLFDKLKNYFDETQEEDIFDYIPSQKTNQIFTPKRVVKQMVDLLEEENPGCFDDPNHTFIDLYVKSGMYITEIVKRLYKSPKLKKLYPDDNARLAHIFEKQVYGLAPTEIIYRIALRYILGFNSDSSNFKHNLRCLDALPYAQEGSLEQKLDEIFSL